ncbi:MAG: ATP-binding protein [Rhodobacteraceae bacterium]|nr:ATP-binding protein [Paracoccaceae bacterium]
MTDSKDITVDLVLRCESSVEDVCVMLTRMEQLLDKADVPSAQRQDAALVMAEALTNIARHGNDAQRGEITCRVSIAQDGLECRITDHGPAFDPSGLGLASPPPEALAEGGYGWFLIRRLTTGLQYQRRDGQNILCFRVPGTPVELPVSVQMS